jgi:6-phosphofructokinase 1
MVNYDLRAVGVPKTIDNDLAATDHTPGFGSAAKFVATTISEILCDTAVYRIPAVTIVEVMGRDAGWLTTSAALPSLNGQQVDYIYLPEVAFSVEAFLDDVREALKRHPNVVIAVSEGIRDAEGNYISASGKKDNFGHVQLTGAGRVLESIVKEAIGCKVRSIELNLPQRCASHIASLTDIKESVMTGEAAVNFAVRGSAGTMVCMKRYESAEYEIYFEALDVLSIANAVRSVPLEYINEAHNGVTQACLDYLAPLIVGELPIVYKNGMPAHFSFD